MIQKDGRRDWVQDTWGKKGCTWWCQGDKGSGGFKWEFRVYAAKRFKNKNESRIRYLQRTIKNATVIDDSSADDEVGVNNTVEVLYEDDESIKIVTTIRADS